MAVGRRRIEAWAGLVAAGASVVSLTGSASIAYEGRRARGIPPRRENGPPTFFDPQPEDDLRRIPLVVLAAITLLTPSVSRAQVFGQLTSAKPLEVNGRMFGGYLQFSENT